MALKIKPWFYPMAFPLSETIGICDTGNIDNPEEFLMFLAVLNHEYLHILLYKLEGDKANCDLDNLPTDLVEERAMQAVPRLVQTLNIRISEIVLQVVRGLKWKR